MKKCSFSSILTQCQEQRFKLTRGWENINHAIQPGCVRWEHPTVNENDDIQAFTPSISADDWVPEVDEDDIPSPLMSDSYESGSESDCDDEKIPLRKTTSNPKKYKFGQ